MRFQTPRPNVPTINRLFPEFDGWKCKSVTMALGRLPFAPIATDDEVHELVRRRALMGRGIGWIDVHLLASAAMAAPARLWTHDKRLAVVAGEMELT